MPAAHAWFLEAPGQPLVERTLELPRELAPGQARVAVAACGLCHTDLGFADGSVRPNHPLPLVLGHEVVGRVEAAAAGHEDLVGQTVIVPAVLPCGDCAWCRAGRGNACPNQRMPGNDVHGGFASHLDVPAAPLVPVGTLAPGYDVRLLSVVADALSTAWQAVARADVQKGDAVFVIGAGGVGGFVAQIAHALGARVIACDVRADTLERLLPYGVEEAVMTAGLEARDVRKRVHAVARGWGVPSLRWRVFECSGHPAGQLIAYSLLQRASTLVQVGFTRARVELRLSNLMAFDATVHGSWGCPPEAYPDVLRLIADGRVVIEPFVDIAPLSRVGEMLQAMAEHRLTHRMILVPDDK